MEVKEVIIFFVVGTLIILVLTLFLIGFLFLYTRRQQQNQLESQQKDAYFKNEILNTQMEVQEATMQHISQELHDNVSQLLGLAQSHLNSLPEKQQKAILVENTKIYIDEALKELRGLSKVLNSNKIEASGLLAAMQYELDRINRSGLLAASIKGNEIDIVINSDTEIILFRIFQESLQNIIKHAQATRVQVSIAQTEQELSLEIKDDGLGFDTTSINLKNEMTAGSGLSNLHNRAKLINATIKIESAINEGTSIKVAVPLIR